MIIVRKFTKEVIKAYADGDAYYLKLYAADLDTQTFRSEAPSLDILRDRRIERSKFLDDLFIL